MKFICWRFPQFTHYSHHSPSVCAKVSWLYYLQGNPLFLPPRGIAAATVQRLWKAFNDIVQDPPLYCSCSWLYYFDLFYSLPCWFKVLARIHCYVYYWLLFSSLASYLQISSLVTMMPLRWLAGWLYMMLTTLMILHGMCSPVLHFPCLLCMWQLVLRTLGAWWCGKHVAFRIWII